MHNLRNALMNGAISLSPACLELFSKWDDLGENFGDEKQWFLHDEWCAEFFNSGFNEHGFYEDERFAEIYYWARACPGEDFEFDMWNWKPAMIACVSRYCMGLVMRETEPDHANFILEQLLREIDFMYQKECREKTIEQASSEAISFMNMKLEWRSRQ